MSQIKIYLTKEQKEKFKTLAHKKGITMNALFRIIFNKYNDDKKI